MALFENPLDELRRELHPLHGLFDSSSGPSGYRQPLGEGEAQSFGKSLLQGGLSGLSYVSSVLDKPGRAIRGGVLGGKPRELLAALPFSDSLGLTDPTQQVSGADLLDQAGLTSKDNDSWARWGGGLATELVTDPLNLIGGLGITKALTPAGQALSKAGLINGVSRTSLTRGVSGLESALTKAGSSASHIEHLAKSGSFIGTAPMEAAARAAGAPLKQGESLAGLAKVGLFPSLGGPSRVVGTSIAPKVAPYVDKAAEYLRYRLPGAKTANAILSPPVLNAMDEVTQKAGRAAGYPAMKAEETAGRLALHPIESKLHDVFKQIHPDDHAEALRTAFSIAETGRPLRSLGIRPDLARLMAPIAEDVVAAYRGKIQKAGSIGAPIDAFAGKNNRFVHRELHLPEGKPQTSLAETSGQVFSPRTKLNRSRLESLYDLPGGTAFINKITQDVNVAGGNRLLASPKKAAAYVRNQMKPVVRELGIPVAKAPKLDAATKADPALLAAWEAALTPAQKNAREIRKQARLLANYAHGLSEPKQLFSYDLTSGLKGYDRSFTKTIGNTEAILHALAKGNRKLQKGDIDLVSALQKLGLKSSWADPKVAGSATSGAGVELGKRIYNKTGQLVDPLLTDGKHLKKMLAGRGVDPATWNALARQYDKVKNTTEQIAPIMGGVSGLTNVSKNLLYSLFLPSHIRNLGSGAFNAALDGTKPASFKAGHDLVRGNATADQLRAVLGDKLPELAGLGDEEARRLLSGKLYAHGNVFTGHNQAEDLASGVSRPANQIREASGKSLIGDAGQAVKDMVESTRSTPLSNQLEMKGVGKGKKDFPFLGMMKTLGTNIEDTVRSSHMIELMRQGFSPEQAAKRMQEVHFDYGPSALTHVESKYIKPAYPFYTFASRNLPFQMGQLVHEPGKIAAQLRPVTNRNPDEYVPQDLASGVALPLGPEQDGKRQFIGQLGLPVEEAFQRLTMKNGMPDVTGTAMKWLSGLNPVLKYPLEQLAGKQFFSGRDLADLKPSNLSTLGGILPKPVGQAVSSLVSNSPVSRLATNAEKLIDPRKSAIQKLLNLTTGVRITDVDIEKRQAAETREKLNELLKQHQGVGSYTNFFVKKGEAVSPDAAEALREQAYLQKKAREAKGVR